MTGGWSVEREIFPINDSSPGASSHNIVAPTVEKGEDEKAEGETRAAGERAALEMALEAEVAHKQGEQAMAKRQLQQLQGKAMASEAALRRKLEVTEERKQRAALSARNQLLKLRNRAIDGLGGVDMGTALRSKVESRVAVHENKPGGGSGGVKSQSEGQLMRGRHQLYWEMLKVRMQKG